MTTMPNTDNFELLAESASRDNPFEPRSRARRARVGPALGTLSLKARLILLISVLSALIAAVGALGLYGMKSANRAMETVYQDRVVPLAELARVLDNLNGARINALEASNAASPDAVRLAVDGTRQQDGEVDAIWKWFMTTYLTPEEAARASRFHAALLDYRRARDVTLDLAARGDPQGAARNADNNAGPKYRIAHTALLDLINIQTEIAAEEHQRGLAFYRLERNITLGAILLSLVFGIGMGILLTRAITGPLQRMMGHFNEIAKGNLTSRIEAHANDEIGQALSALAATQETQRKLVDEIKAAVASLSSAASQIAAGNADLSHRTEEQASSLQETAVSMEEVSTTVRNNVDNTRQASRIAHDTSEIAERGGEKNRLAIGKMDELNASSDQISGIISIIDNIAFQTNLLSLNASVEAARAGERGRGFAVVATEVRSLAQRSAEAAKEIQALINVNSEIVRQTGSYVTESGAAMKAIVEEVRKVSRLMADIVQGSEEQSSAIEQVTVAITQMDQTTQQNAALVEESAEAAASLEDQARQLAHVVSVFRTGS